MFQTAVFTDCQAFASRLQLFLANLVFFARFQAFGRRLVGRGHGAVTLDVFFSFFVSVLRVGCGEGGAHKQCSQHGKHFLNNRNVSHEKFHLD